MKKIGVILVLVFIFGTTFTSCTKDISGPVDLDYLEGKWNFKKSTASSSGLTLPYSTDYLKNEDGCNKDYVEILAGGVVKFRNYMPNCDFEDKVGAWTLNGNSILISVDGSSFNGTFDIASLSETELILKINGTYEGKSGTLNLYFTK